MTPSEEEEELRRAAERINEACQQPFAVWSDSSPATGAESGTDLSDEDNELLDGIWDDIGREEPPKSA